VRRFTELYLALDATTRRLQKVGALVDYFRGAAAADAAWALYLLCGRRLLRALPSPRLRRWVAEEAGWPLWLVEECYDNVGDLSETLSLLVPDPGPGTDAPLAEVIERQLLPLAQLDSEGQRRAVVSTWRELDRPQCFLFHKLISGAFRVGVARQTVVQALSEVSGVAPAVVAHRLMGTWRPAPEDYKRLLNPQGTDVQEAQPYPFYLASPLEAALETLGDIGTWQVEWKWDGVRAQLIRRGGHAYLWSRGEELVNEQFPEIVAAAQSLSEDAVLDGELLAWERDGPLPFHYLQRRLNRKRVIPVLFHDIPVIFMAYDLLERGGNDCRAEPLSVRREALRCYLSACASPVLRVSPVLPGGSWGDVARLRSEARRAGTEGVMLKSRSAPYGVGRQRGAWWKLKCEPYVVDAVLTAAQRGHGKRATRFTDYTFAVWHQQQLVTIAKAYSGLIDAEIREVDRFVRRNTTERHGPVHVVRPELVFELAFEGIQPSDRHRSGLALRFPRIARRRMDKRPAEADTLDALRALLMMPEAGR
jgi:DNA ligase-1